MWGAVDARDWQSAGQASWRNSQQQLPHTEALQRRPDDNVRYQTLPVNHPLCILPLQGLGTEGGLPVQGRTSLA